MAQTAQKTEPQGEWLSETQIGKRMKLHRQTVAARLEDLGIEPDEERSNAKLKVYWFDTELEFAIKAAKDESAALKIRGLRADAQLKELKLAKEQGELVRIEEVIEIVQKIGVAIYQEFAIRQPKRIGPALAKAKNVTSVKQKLKTDTEKIMKRLRANFEEFIA